MTTPRGAAARSLGYILPAIFRHNPYLISDYNDDSARARLLGVGLMLHHEFDKILTVHTDVL